MARRQDTRAKPPKASSKSKPAKVEKVASAAKPKGKKSAKSSVPPASKGASKALLDAVRTPVSAATTAKGKAKKTIRSAKDTARTLVSDLPKPSVPDLPAAALAAVPHQLGDAFKAIGSQIAGALNTDVGRVMVAELLVYVAKSLTQAAAQTETAGDAKSALLNAGAKIGAAAADAGAKMAETGKSAAKAGSDLLDGGRSVAGAGASAAGEAAGGARDLVREVAQVAVSTVGGMVADVATKAISKRGRKASAPEPSSPDGSAPATSGSAGGRPPVI